MLFNKPPGAGGNTGWLIGSKLDRNWFSIARFGASKALFALEFLEDAAFGEGFLWGPVR